MSGSAACPSCSGRVVVSGLPELHQRVVCPRCDAVLEVVLLDPLELDWHDDEGRDYPQGSGSNYRDFEVDF